MKSEHCGPDIADASYDSYYNLYSSIFTLPSNTPIHHVPGNHDIPLGPFKQFSQYARERYTKHFSSPNEVISIANHSIVLLDSVGLVEEDYRRYASEMQFGEWDGVEGGVIEFVKSVGDSESTIGLGRTLLTSSAGYRPQNTHFAYPPRPTRECAVRAVQGAWPDTKGCWTGISEFAGERDEPIFARGAATFHRV